MAQRNKISAYASQNMVCESNLWCYEALNFLAPYTNVKTKYMDDIQVSQTPNYILKNGDILEHIIHTLQC